MAEAALALAAPWAGEQNRMAIVDLFWGSGAFLDPLAGQREEGLGDHLLFGSSTGSIERKTGVPGLTLVPAGAGSPETRSALEGDGMKSFVAGLRERFDIAFLCGDIPVEADRRHPLVDWVDGWVGIINQGESPGKDLGASFGIVELAPQESRPVEAPIEAPRPPPVPEPVAVPPPAVRPASERAPDPAPVALAAKPDRKVPRRVSRNTLVAVLVVALGIPAAWALWNTRPQDAERGEAATRREVGAFPKPSESTEAEIASREIVSLESRPGGQAGLEVDSGTGAEEIPEASAGEAPSNRTTADIRRPPAAESAVALEPSDDVWVGAYAVHVSSYRSIHRAESEAGGLETRGYEAEVVTVELPDRGTWYRVWVGRLATREEARVLAQRLQEEEAFDYTRIVKR